MSIVRLPQNLINQIAAGEVVERPASVVKELVENAIDAGAGVINIHLRHGGKSFICITDDGKGMSKEDLSLCLDRHATSKLPDKALENISFLGFRGEALPALGSISRMKITSKEKDASGGWSVEVAGGEKKQPRPEACVQGTTVELRDLFYATPARLKFLKSDSTEYQHCSEILTRLAMAHPHVTFTLKHNDRQTASWQGVIGEVKEQLQERVGHILGEEFTANALYYEARQGLNKIGLLAGLPTMNRSQASYQYIFVNNRPVRDKIFYSAIRQAYQDYLSKDRHPMIVAYIEVPSDEVDVNVHPAKTEVRFRFPQAVRQLIGKSLLEALKTGAHQASTTIAQSMYEKFQAPTGYKNPIDSKKNSTFSPFEKGRAYQSLPSKPLPTYVADNKAELFPARETYSLRHLEKEETEESMAVEKEEMPPLGFAVAQVHKTYIVAQAKDGLVLVDQHAAHERIIYEKFKKHWENKSVEAQILLSPVVVEMTEEQVELFFKNQTFLEKMGLKFEVFGAQGILVRELPSLLGSDISIKDLIKDIGDDLLQMQEPSALKEKIFYRLATRACHGSVRSGREMGVQEMNALLRQIEETPFSGQCNHGRPTYVKLQLKDLERLFGRE